MQFQVGLHQQGTKACGEVTKIIMVIDSQVKGTGVPRVEILVMAGADLGIANHHLAMEGEEVLVDQLLKGRDCVCIMRMGIARREHHVIIGIVECRMSTAAETGGVMRGASCDYQSVAVAVTCGSVQNFHLRRYQLSISFDAFLYL